MRQIIRKILAAPVPVVTYVHPSGARAASAGTFILYASHVAAMTPGTNLGAATPVQIGAAPAAPGEEEEGAAPAQGAGERKAVNDAVAYIRSLAELRGRDADWGEEAVREAASLSADAALSRGVVDIVARDMPTLLEDLDGRTVTVGGAERVLGTAGIEIVDLDPDWTTRVLATITDPNVALILMMVGIYGLLFEFMNPGALVPGTIGAISLLIGLYALAALPVDFVGVALILLGIALMVAEAFAPSFGILGLGGIAAFAVGGAILIDTDVPEFQVDWAAIAALGVFSAALLVAIARLAIRSRRGRVHTGREELIGATGKVLDWENGTGHVFVHSERWNASGAASLKKGAPVVVQDVDGLRLRVSSIDDAEAGR
jgi:membrane-bound serine protease (ClpP class)